PLLVDVRAGVVVLPLPRAERQHPVSVRVPFRDVALEPPGGGDLADAATARGAVEVRPTGGGPCAVVVEMPVDAAVALDGEGSVHIDSPVCVDVVVDH